MRKLILFALAFGLPGLAAADIHSIRAAAAEVCSQRVPQARSACEAVHASRSLMMAHGDIWSFRAAFLATDAEALFWQPILSWIRSH